MKYTPNDIATLKATNKQLLEKIAQPEAEIAKLRRRLGLDSTHNSKPPSSNGYKNKTVAPALPRENHRKGGQEGHKGCVCQYALVIFSVCFEWCLRGW